MKPRGGRRLTKAEVTTVLGRFRKVKPWPADKVERRDPVEYQRHSQVLIAICINEFCRSWTPKRQSYCVVCHTRQPTYNASESCRS